VVRDVCVEGHAAEPIIDALSKALQQAISDPETKARFAGSGAQTVSAGATPAALRAFLQSEFDRWVPIIKKAGVTAE
jgi:tripartite-type tricarboxylate transporter receptor subunit TctC